jgi:gliding motility-associated-like protein
MPLRVYFYALFLQMMFCCAAAQGQVTLTMTQTNPVSDLVACGDAQQFRISISGKTSKDTAKNILLTVNMPDGVQYVPNSLSDTSIKEFSIANLRKPVFRIPDILPGKSVSFNFSAGAICSIIDAINNGDTIRNFLRITYKGGHDSAYSNRYTIGIPSIAITKITNQVITRNGGDTFSRNVTIVNTTKAPLSRVHLYIVHGNGIKILSVKGKTITFSGDTAKVVLDSADFVKIGNKDKYLDLFETLVVTDYDSLRNCNGTQTTYIAGWGCGTDLCQEYINTANVLSTARLPTINISTSTSTPDCYDPTEPNEQSIRISNAGPGTAFNVLVDIMQSAGVGFYNSALKSRMDETSFTMQKGAGAPKSYTPDSIISNINYSCLGVPDPKGRAMVKIPEIKSGESVTLRWNTYNCCIDEGTINGWSFVLNYEDQCTATHVVTGLGAVPYFQDFSDPQANTTDIILHDTIPYYLQFPLAEASFLPGGTKPYFVYEFTSDPSVILDESRIALYNNTNTYRWDPDSVSVAIISGKRIVKAYFRYPAPISFRGAGIEMFIAADTAAGTVKCGQLTALNVKLKYIPSRDCNCISLLMDNNYPLTLNCINPLNSGLFNAKFNFYRTSYGLPDNDDNGLPDSTGSLDFSLIKRDRAMYGDTVTAFFTGKILTDTIHTSWKYGFGDVRFSDDYLTAVEATINVLDSSADTTFTCNNVPTERTVWGYKYYFSTDTLRYSGCGLPAGFVYEQGDSIWLTFRYRVTKNTTDLRYIRVTDEFFMSDKSEPGALDDHYYVDRHLGSFTVLGFSQYACCGGIYNAFGCTNVKISQSYNFLPAAGMVGYNVFPFEYRNWSSISTIKVRIPDGYSYKSSMLKFTRTSGPGSILISDSISPYLVLNDTLYFSADSFFKPLGLEELPDDGFYITLESELIPGCSVGSDYSLAYVKFHSILSPFLDTVKSDLITVQQLVLERPVLELLPDLPQVFTETDTFSWYVHASNISPTSDANNVWLAFKSGTGKIVVDSVLDASNTKLVSKNDIFRVGQILKGGSTVLRIRARMFNCETDSIQVTLGSDCEKYPDSVGANNCLTRQVTLNALPRQPGLLLGMEAMADSVRLCDTALVSVQVKNTQTGTASDVIFQVSLPQGSKIVDSTAMLEFPAGNGFVAIANPDSLNPFTYIFKASEINAQLRDRGLIGLADTTRNSFIIRFRLVNDCEFISGSSLSFSASALDACGDLVSRTTLESSPLKIIGARQPYSTGITHEGATVPACGNGAPFTITVINLGPNATQSPDNIFIDLPPGLRYLRNTLVPLINGPSDTSFTSLSLAGTTRCSWQMPKDVAVGDTVQFRILLAADTNSVCGNVPVYLFSTATARLTCVSNNASCSIKLQTGKMQKAIEVSKPLISITAFEAWSEPASSTEEKVHFTTTLKNTGDSLLAAGHPHVAFYYDADGSTTYSPGDVFLGADTLKNDIPFGQTIALHSSLKVPSGKVCGLIAVYDTVSTNCSCLPSSAYYKISHLENAGSDTAICSGRTITLGRTAISGYAYSWQPVTGLSDPSSANPTLTVTTDTLLTYSYELTTIRDSGCIARDTVVISIFPNPVAKPGFSRTICSGENVTLGEIPAVVGGVGPYTYLWLPASRLSNNKVANPVAAPLKTTMYHLVVTDSIGCLHEDSVMITVLPLPKITAGPDQVICLRDSVKLGGSPTASHSTAPYHFKWSPATGLSSDTVANPTASPKSSVTYTLVVTDAKGCKSTDSVYVKVNPLPKVDAGADAVICFGDSAMLGTASKTYYAYKWLPQTGLNNAFIAQPYAQPAFTTTYHLSVTDTNGCTEYDSVTVKVNALPVIDAGADRVICFNSTTMLGGDTVAKGELPFTYEWSPGAGLSDSSAPNPAVTLKNSRTFYLKVTDGHGCVQRDTVKITVQPLPVISAGPDLEICRGSRITLLATTKKAYTYSWSPGKLVSDSTILKPKAFPDSTSIFILKATDVYGCVSTDTVRIKVHPVTPLDPPALKCVDIADSDNIHLTWKPIAHDSEFKYYVLYRREGLTAAYLPMDTLFDIDQNKYLDSTIADALSKSYSYFLKTINYCDAEGKSSDTLSSIILKAQKIGDKTLLLTWNPQKSGMVNYRVLQYAADDTTMLQNTVNNYFIMRSCDNKGACRVEVNDPLCTSSSNISDTIRLLDTIAPEVGFPINATVLSHSRISIEFYASDSADTRFYYLYKAGSAGTFKLLATIPAGNDTFFTYLDNTVAAGDSNYYYRFLAEDTCGNVSLVYSATHHPVLLQGSAGNDQNYLRWTRYKGFDVKEQQVQRLEAGTWKMLHTLPAGDTIYTDSLIPCNVSQYYRIASVESGGRNFISLSDTIALTPFDTIKPAPPILHSADMLPGRMVELKWNWDLATDVKFFEIYRRSDHAAALKIATVVYDSTYVDKNLPGTKDTLSYYIIAADSCSSLNRSQPSPADTLMNLNLKTAACVPLIRLYWSPYRHFTAGEDGYEVYRADSGSSVFSRIKTLGSTVRSWTDSAVVESKKYVYKIRAVDKSKLYDSYSDTAALRPFVFPAPAATEMAYTTVTSSDDAGGSIRILWHPVPPDDTLSRGYKIYHATDPSGPYTLVGINPGIMDTVFNHKAIDTRNVEHYYLVKTYNLCDVESDTGTVHSPVKLAAVNRNLRIELTWKNYRGFDSVGSYSLMRSDNGKAARLMSIGQAQLFTDTNVQCGHRYSYFVMTQAYNQPYISWSDTVDITAFDSIPPPPPHIRLATVEKTGNGSGQVKLIFKGNKEKNRQGYKIYKSESAGIYSLAFTLPDTSSSDIVQIHPRINTVSAVNSYYVTAYDSCGNESMASDTHSVVLLQVLAVSQTNTVNWTAYTAWDSLEYVLQRKTTFTPWKTMKDFPAAVLSYNDSAVQCDTFYLYRIIAMNGRNGDSSVSNLSGDTAFETVLPGLPVIRSVSVEKTGFQNGAVRISWPPSSSPDFNYFNLYRKQTLGTWHLLATKLKIPGYVDTSLNTSETNYSYYIDAVDSCHNVSSGPAGYHQSMVLNATPGNEQIRLAWNPYVGWPVREYIVYRDSVAIATLAGGDTAYVDTTTICPRSYVYRIMATSALDSSATAPVSYSNFDTAAAFDHNPPRAVYFINASVSQPNSRVTLQWTRSTNRDFAFYEIWRSEPGAGIMKIATVSNVDTTSYVDHAVLDRQYCYYIRVSDFCNNISVYSNPACIIILKGHTADSGNALQWNPYSRWASGVSRYVLYRKIDNGNYTYLDLDTTNFSYMDTAISGGGKDYCYQVVALDKSAFGAMSFSTEVCLVRSPIVWVPNAFSPGNNDGLNEWFGPKGLFIEHYEMDIYNRWGEKIYTTTQSKPWDGTYHGKPVVDGVYYYQIVVKGYQGETLNYHGVVTLLK